MKIGVTEQGDAGLDFSWYEKILEGKVDGAVLITKQLSEKFIEKVMDLHEKGYRLIVHCDCTGWGKTVIEPNVPDYRTQLSMLSELIGRGFPKQNCVLRIDPIFPTESGLKRVAEVIAEAYYLELLPDLRVRISVLDEYPHVKERFKEAGFSPLYGGRFQATEQMLTDVVKALEQFDLKYETCAEKTLSQLATKDMFEPVGCISAKDIDIMGLQAEEAALNPQKRSGCLCLSCKTELLDYKHPCPHGCLYCYWKH